MKNKIVCIVGLGYVGLPLAKAFSKHLKVVGYDVDEEKIRNLGNNNNTNDNIEFTSDPAQIKQADFVLICVPTPVTKSKEPDLSYAIRSRNCWTAPQKRRCRSPGVNNLSRSY
jgi:UDPglucose 6-dehydrogenase/UDP-N-acetyl-D-galactosamine dehydrogenase